MNAPKFIRYNKSIINVHDIVSVCYQKDVEISIGETRVAFIHGRVFVFNGDVRDELWELIKFAMQPKGESYPSDTTDLEQRIEGIEKKIGKSFTTQNQVPTLTTNDDQDRLRNATIKAAKRQQSLKEKIIIGYTELGHPVYGV